MKFFPFIFKSIIIDGDKDSFIKMVNDNVEFEKKSSQSSTPKKYFKYDNGYECRDNYFVITPTASLLRNNLSYMPVLRCKITTTQHGKIKLDVFIYPSLGGTSTVVLGYILCIFVIYFDISKGNSPLAVISLMASIYFAIMYFFNVRSKEFLLYLDSIIEIYGKEVLHKC